VRISASAPTRIDLAGGTIDIWPLYLFHPGAQTLNAAISLRAHAWIEERPDERIEPVGGHDKQKTCRLITPDDQTLPLLEAGPPLRRSPAHDAGSHPRGGYCRVVGVERRVARLRLTPGKIEGEALLDSQRRRGAGDPGPDWAAGLSARHGGIAAIELQPDALRVPSMSIRASSNVDCPVLHRGTAQFGHQ
jgi:hypothetical protein